MADVGRRLAARDVEETTFSTSLRGYDTREVDWFLDQVSESLRSCETRRGSPRLNSRDVELVTFSTSLRGYDLDEIDNFLDEALAALRQHELEASRPDPGVLDLTEERFIAPDPTPDQDDAADEPVVRSPMSSEELLEKAKKWQKRK